MVSGSCQWIVSGRRREELGFQKRKLPLVWEEKKKSGTEPRCAADMRVRVYE